MIYTCPNCGGYFDAKQFQTFGDHSATTAKCKYCGATFNFKSIHTSHVINGYNALAAGHYADAYRSFGYAIDLTKDEDGQTIHELAYVDAYLGRALAQFDVQVVYEDEVGMEEDAPPMIICHSPHKDRFQDCDDFNNAAYLINKIPNNAHRARQLKRLQDYADYIDGIKDMYDKLDMEGKDYQLFIAYEDLSKDRAEAYEMAQKVKKMIPTKHISKIFCPDPDEADKNMVNYEAKILYALNHSQCMLVLVDRDVDNRLIEMYSRFDEIRRQNRNRNKGIKIGFVRYSGQFQLHLGDHKVTENIFRDADRDGIVNFVLQTNGISVSNWPDITDKDKDKDKDNKKKENIVEIEESVGAPPVILDSAHVSFGRYPQSRENSQIIKKHFIDTFGRPTAEAPGDWKPLCCDKKEKQPYMWYVEDTVNGSRYRAVYFVRYREVYSYDDNSPKAEAQRKNGYILRDVHVFKYEPVIWNVIKTTEGAMPSATLMTSMGLDARGFNDAAYGNEFMESTLAQWLNREMIQTLFVEEELTWLYKRNGYHVRLLDADIELDSPATRLKVKNYNIGGSDYFLCVGGSLLYRNVNAYWVESDSDREADKAAVIFPSVDAEVREMPLDCTTVAVVPTIRIRLPESGKDI